MPHSHRAPTLCSIYCSPMCCLPSAIQRPIKNASFKVTRSVLTKHYWVDPEFQGTCGVYAVDTLVFKDHYSAKSITLHNATFAIQAVVGQDEYATYARPSNRFGLRRRIDNQTLAQIMHKNGLISRPVVMLHFFDYPVFGSLNSSLCAPFTMIDVSDELEWIFNGSYLRFLKLEYREPFKMAVTDGNIMSISRTLLSQLIEIRCLTYDFSFNYNVTCGTADDVNVWQLKDYNIQLKTEVFHGGMPNNSISISPIEPNPDNYVWRINM
ncbi:unnamed protein product [Bursaphelenchus okinawaensis]|uniref:Peptidase A1 domain-containing protein n=1 Tax=Bursaphelenchus okinawaensis TaxID=465554 RepID=A0A811KBE0_9BILA|nr:unnamed protein product [Bursaphelenchus okinawaensis]CAG9099015.1 unnamed protein product [Bursaphelenchus okinawaensis]